MIVCYFVADTLALVDQQCSHHSKTWCCPMPQNFVAIHNISHKVLTQHIVCKIRCVDGYEQRWTDVDGWKGPNGGNWMKVEWALNERWTKVGQTSDENHTNVEQKFDQLQTKVKWKSMNVHGRRSMHKSPWMDGSRQQTALRTPQRCRALVRSIVMVDMTP
jgi:hypothetical protein